MLHLMKPILSSFTQIACEEIKGWMWVSYVVQPIRIQDNFYYSDMFDSIGIERKISYIIVILSLFI